MKKQAEENKNDEEFELKRETKNELSDILPSIEFWKMSQKFKLEFLSKDIFWITVTKIF